MHESRPSKPDVTFDHFAALDIRVGVILSAESIPKKTKLLKLSVDVGEEQPRTIVSGLALTFIPSQLVWKRVLVVCNLAPRDFGKGLVSRGMILASHKDMGAAPVENMSYHLELPTVGDEVRAGTEVTLIKGVDQVPLVA